MKITAVLTMDRIEESVRFWTDKAGFEVTVSVPHGDSMGFAILQKGDAELMLQSNPSVAGDIPQLAGFARAAKSFLFVEVDDFDGTVSRLEGAPVAFPVRETPYGMKELGVFEPGGHVAVFACRLAQ
ncbi:MAG: VOC family protein [Bryobacterales bacterium]|nr:VOC family protein [Bryobacterales bacterium]